MKGALALVFPFDVRPYKGDNIFAGTKLPVMFVPFPRTARARARVTVDYLCACAEMFRQHAWMYEVAPRPSIIGSFEVFQQYLFQSVSQVPVNVSSLLML